MIMTPSNPHPVLKILSFSGTQILEFFLFSANYLMAVADSWLLCRFSGFYQILSCVSLPMSVTIILHTKFLMKHFSKRCLIILEDLTWLSLQNLRDIMLPQSFHIALWVALIRQLQKSCRIFHLYFDMQKDKQMRKHWFKVLK